MARHELGRTSSESESASTHVETSQVTTFFWDDTSDILTSETNTTVSNMYENLGRPREYKEKPQIITEKDLPEKARQALAVLKSAH